jgi:DNA invertase Pin-like site-specific DNA recombinase
MKPTERKVLRCAIYTRKSTEHNLDLEFNSLDAQREACEAYIKSQAHEGWRLVPDRYDDGAFSGASLDRPALQALLADVRASRITTVVVYKVDRLTRSLADFAKLVELFDEFAVSFVSVTQSFNTTSSMGRLTLNVLLSFAQFEREVIGGCATRLRPPSARASGLEDRSRSATGVWTRSSWWCPRRRRRSVPSSPATWSLARSEP